MHDNFTTESIRQKLNECFHASEYSFCTSCISFLHQSSVGTFRAYILNLHLANLTGFTIYGCSIWLSVTKSLNNL